MNKINVELTYTEEDSASIKKALSKAGEFKVYTGEKELARVVAEQKTQIERLCKYIDRLAISPTTQTKVNAKLYMSEIGWCHSHESLLCDGDCHDA